jgi:hypothetical protein
MRSWRFISRVTDKERLGWKKVYAIRGGIGHENPGVGRARAYVDRRRCFSLLYTMLKPSHWKLTLGNALGNRALRHLDNPSMTVSRK